MSKKMRVFTRIFLGIIVCFLSFTATFYMSIREMRRNHEQSLSTNAVAEPDAEDFEPGKHFKSTTLLNNNFIAYGKSMGYRTADEYESGAVNVIGNTDALHKTYPAGACEIYYIVETNEYVEVSDDGYIMAYFKPESGKEYFDSK